MFDPRLTPVLTRIRGADLREETPAQRKSLPELSVPSLSGGSYTTKYTEKKSFSAA